jgi:hypothetical protein
MSAAPALSRSYHRGDTFVTRRRAALPICTVLPDFTLQTDGRHPETLFFMA